MSYQTTDENLETRVAALEEIVCALQGRNQRVEMDKAWEISRARTTCIALITYVTTAIVFRVIDAPHPFLSAIIPTLGYLLSTLSIPVIKCWWSKDRL